MLLDDSILKTVKRTNGLSEDYDAFDVDIMVAINNAFTALTQLGVGPDEGFCIEDDTAKWADFVNDTIKCSSVKSYICLKTRLQFDPPTSGYLIDLLKEEIKEAEFRLSVMFDKPEEVEAKHD